jgi:hyperosmotically inducible protein
MTKTAANRSGRKAGASAAVALSFAMALSMTATGWAQNTVSNESVHEQDLSAQSAAKHHYNSPAERAEDDLLIVKVKAAIADEGLADDSPMTVDADHGRVTLTGVLASREDVQRAVGLVAGIDGVKGVNNRLSWEKNPE